MRNDDYEAVEALERALRSAEREIAELEREAKVMQETLVKVLHELQELQCPTHMGEPVINTDREDARRWRWITRQGRVRDILIPANEARESINAAFDKQMSQRNESSQSA